MFVRIDNTPRDYAWGSRDAIAQLFGREPSGSPEAELWLGAHHGSPARILEPQFARGAATLADWVHDDPRTTVGHGTGSDAGGGAEGEPPRLPFLLKVLAAAQPLSLQAHPSSEQARAGFARENAAEVPLLAAHRNYKDPFHKPEMIYALSERFDALCGFRDPVRAAADVDRLVRAAAGDDRHLRMLAGRLREEGDVERVLRAAVGWLLGGGDDVDRLVTEATRAASNPQVAASSPSIATLARLAETYPGDPGTVLSLLLNRVTLTRGEALYLPAGNIHAYLEGLGVELMAASDNVLRGGLTPKYVDVPELLTVLDFEPSPVPYLHGQDVAPGVRVFQPDVDDFRLARVTVAGDRKAGPVSLDGPAIILCTDGDVEVCGGAGADVALSAGDAVFVTPDEASLTATGAGTLFAATTGQRA